MTLNDVLTKQNVITKLNLKEGNKELSKELKVKIMRIRMKYNSVKKKFDEETKEFSEQIITDELKDLAQKSERTEAENNRFDELNIKVNSEYQDFLIQKGKEEITDSIEDDFTIDEYAEILDINSDNDVEINDNKIKATDFMEIFMELFVKE